MEHNFSTNKKILNLCFRWHILHILRSYCFVVEVTFNKVLANSKVVKVSVGPNTVILLLQILWGEDWGGGGGGRVGGAVDGVLKWCS